MMPIRWMVGAAGLVVLVAIARGDLAAQSASVPTMTLLVDETQASRRLTFVHEDIRVQQGPLTLAFPRWIPGEHGPTGPIENFAALRVRSGDVTLPWRRDPGDINTIRMDVPPNTQTITVDFDTLLENTISDHQLLLAWNTAILYPRGVDRAGSASHYFELHAFCWHSFQLLDTPKHL
jgi:Peptidase M61 N-terminal domain